MFLGKSATTTMIAPGGQTLSGHVSGGSLDTIRLRFIINHHFNVK